MGSVSGTELFENEITGVLEKYPKLSVNSANGKIILKGDIELIDEHGVYRDTYSIEIHPVAAFPFRFPYVFETGGKLPWNVDWHVFENDGHCCIKVEPEEILICKNGITLLNFIEQQVFPYFFNQTFRRINGYYINERAHGLLGIINFYREQFKEKNVQRLIMLMEFVLNNREPNRVSKCFCGTGNKYRKCHKDAYRMLHDIGVETVSIHLVLIKELISKVIESNKKEVTVS